MRVDGCAAWDLGLAGRPPGVRRFRQVLDGAGEEGW